MGQQGMKPGFYAPRDTLEKKPRHGTPCNGCGLCCLATVCSVGRQVLGRDDGPCPALRWHDGKSSCGLVVDPAAYRPDAASAHTTGAMGRAAALMIGAGDGCDARFNGEPADPGAYARWVAQDHKNELALARARGMWGLT